MLKTAKLQLANLSPFQTLASTGMHFKFGGIELFWAAITFKRPNYIVS